jgi:hypothetical protein
VPDVGLTPWLTPPQHTYETVDIWVDSSCNGFEDFGFPLRYGRDAMGNVRLNGDDFCANELNRVYARIRNYGTRAADDVTVRFYVTTPLGVGIRDAAGWSLIGSASPAEFPVELSSIPPGDDTVVWVPWTPAVTPPFGETGRRFPYHTCLQVKVDTVSGERLLVNQDGDREQENLSHAEARRELAGVRYDLIEHEVNLTNTFNQRETFLLWVDSDDLPPGWIFTFGTGESRYDLDGGQTRRIPVQLRVPDSTPLGTEKVLKVFAAHKMGHMDHHTGEVVKWMNMPVGGAEIVVRTVLDSRIHVSGIADPPGNCKPKLITAAGCLDPGVPGAPLNVSFRSPSGAEGDTIVATDSSGCYSASASAGDQGGIWTVEAFWHGDQTHGSASSGTMEVVAAVPGDMDCDAVPDASDNCPANANPNQGNADQDARGDACDCLPGDPGVWAAPSFVSDLQVSLNAQSPFFTDLSWSPLDVQAGPGVVYDIVSGDAAKLRTPEALTDSQCLWVDVQGTSQSVFQLPPQPGQIFWYLVRGQTSCGRGSYDSGKPGQVSGRDGRIAQSRNQCA